LEAGEGYGEWIGDMMQFILPMIQHCRRFISAFFLFMHFADEIDAVGDIFVWKQPEDLDPVFPTGPWKSDVEALESISAYARNLELGGGGQGAWSQLNVARDDSELDAAKHILRNNGVWGKQNSGMELIVHGESRYSRGPAGFFGSIPLENLHARKLHNHELFTTIEDALGVQQLLRIKKYGLKRAPRNGKDLQLDASSRFDAGLLRYSTLAARFNAGCEQLRN
jgi:hypothetical protein